MQADAPVRLVRASAPQSSPALVVDDEHKRPTLEQRLDAAVLAAGATPPHGLRPPKLAQKNMVPLRLAPPPPSSMAPKRRDDSEDRAPAPRMLQFLLDEAARPGLADDSVSAIPRLEPVVDSGKVAVAYGVSTNVYRFGSIVSEETPSRPLPILALDGGDVETRVLRRGNKVMTLKSLDGDVSLSAFSFRSVDDDQTTEGFAEVDRAPHAPAAVALQALSDEGWDVEERFEEVDIAGDDLDELARQLGLEGMVPRTTPPTRADDSLDGVAAIIGRSCDDDLDGIDEIDEIDADDVELVAVPTPTDSMRAMVVSRPVVQVKAAAALEDEFDDDVVSDDEVTAVGRVSLLPSSLLEGIDIESERRSAMQSFDDDVTPAHGTLKPSLEAPAAVRFVVAEAPARPRHQALTDAERQRNRARAHDLYLIALDDIACRDPHSAVVHLELALAYDDETPLYLDLLLQLNRQIHKPQAEFES
jgi:hypothetical protein